VCGSLTDAAREARRGVGDGTVHAQRAVLAAALIDEGACNSANGHGFAWVSARSEGQRATPQAVDGQRTASSQGNNSCSPLGQPALVHVTAPACEADAQVLHWLWPARFW
jgi:hypothetical protein